jgi:membrane protease YdiL (CAAX protease family)
VYAGRPRVTVRAAGIPSGRRTLLLLRLSAIRAAITRLANPANLYLPATTAHSIDAHSGARDSHRPFGTGPTVGPARTERQRQTGAATVNTVVTLVGLAIALSAFEGVSRVQAALDRPDDTLEEHCWKWVVPLVVASYVLVVEGKRLATIGWTAPDAVPFAYYATVGLAAMLATTVILAPIRERMDSADEMDQGLAEFATFTHPERLFVAATAGVTEEVPYRGYTIERVAALTGSPLLGAAVSLVAFLWAHVGDRWSVGAALQMAQPTVVLLALYLWTRSLPVVMAVHAVWDAFGLLFADRAAEQTDP